MTFALQSSAFAPGAPIPRQNTCDAADQSPPLSWNGLPARVASLVLIVEDPDAPGGTFTHWVLYDLPPAPGELAAGAPHTSSLQNGARQGRNDFRRVGYGGPCPPRGTTHHYHFIVMALDTRLGLPAGVKRSELESRVKGHVVGRGELVATYRRQ